MNLKLIRPALLFGTLAVGTTFVAPAFAFDAALKEHCEALASRFKTVDVSHMAADKLEAARRQANHGERLCKTEPEIGVKALDLAFRDIGVSTRDNGVSTNQHPPSTRWRRRRSRRSQAWSVSSPRPGLKACRADQ